MYIMTKPEKNWANFRTIFTIQLKIGLILAFMLFFSITLRIIDFFGGDIIWGMWILEYWEENIDQKFAIIDELLGEDDE